MLIRVYISFAAFNVVMLLMTGRGWFFLGAIGFLLAAGFYDRKKRLWK